VLHGSGAGCDFLVIEWGWGLLDHECDKTNVVGLLGVNSWRVGGELGVFSVRFSLCWSRWGSDSWVKLPDIKQW